LTSSSGHVAAFGDRRHWEDLLLERGREQQQVRDLRDPSTRQPELPRRVGQVVVDPSPNLSVEVVGEGEKPSHAQATPRGGRACRRPRVAHPGEVYRHRRPVIAQVVDSADARSAVSNEKPVAENASCNVAVAPL
jgi:hypothetical protein